MNRRPAATRSHRRSRPASFSLTEVLVVMGIMAFLSAVIVAAIPRVQNAARISATRATIKKVDELLNDRLNGFKRWIATQDRLAGDGPPSYVTTAGYNTLFLQNRALATILSIKAAYKTNFAQIYSELPLSIRSANPQGGSHTASAESAACLYLILTKGPLFDTEPPSAGDLKAIEVADTDNDGLPEIVDSWGHPLRYYRWPTRLVRPGTPSGSPQTFSGQTVSNAGAPSAAYDILIQPQFPIPWRASTYYASGDIVVPNAASFIAFRCTTGGTSGSSQPAWPTIQNQTVSDGPVRWLSGPVSGISARLLISSINYPASIPTTIAQELGSDQTLSKDPDDPQGVIDAATNPNNPQASATAATNFETAFHTPDTYWVPLIVSAGPDEQLGLFEPSDGGSFGTLGQPRTDLTSGDPAGINALIDNITNHQR